jgi:hypothetical protein
MKIALVLMFACGLFGCATMVPEKTIHVGSNTDSEKDLASAIAYADTTMDAYQKLQTQTSEQQSGLNIATFGLGMAGGAAVAYNKPIQTIKAIAILLAGTSGAEVLLSPAAKRNILAQGMAAIDCAKYVALTMDAAPAALGSGTPSPTRQTAPLVAFAARRAEAPSPQSPLSRNGAPISANASQEIRDYAIALTTPYTAAPRAPGSPAPEASTAPLAPLLFADADTHDASMNELVATATTTSYSAPRTLVRTVDLISLIVLDQLHRSDPNTKDIYDKVKTANSQALTDLEQALSAAKKQTDKTLADIGAVTKVTAAMAPATGPTAQPENPPEDIEDNKQGSASGQTSGQSNDTQTNTDSAGSNSSASNAKKAGNATQADANLLAIISAMVDQEKQCKSGGN